MKTPSLKTHKELKNNFWHYFLGTLSDNSIELTWILVMSLYAVVNKDYSNKSITLFGFTDALWVVYSASYYVARTTMVYNIAEYMVGRKEHEASIWIKSALYLSYILLLPLAIPSLIWSKELLTVLGVSSNLISFYVPYFRLCLLSILICPTRVIIPSYYTARFKAKIGAMLNTLTAITMPIIAAISLWILNWGVNGMMICCFIANTIPLIYFLFNAPKNFFKKGLEFDLIKIKHLWKDAKWELIRRLAPRISQVYVASLLVSLNPALLSARYLIYTIGSFLEGYVDSTAVVCNANVSHSIGCGVTRKESYKDNKYIWRLGAISLLITLLILISSIKYWSFILTSDNNVKIWLINIVIWIIFLFEILAKLRYYVLLSVTRTIYKEYNGIAQLCYAVPTAILTPILVTLLLKIYPMNLYGVFISSAIVAITQFLLCELYLRNKNIKIDI